MNSCIWILLLLFCCNGSGGHSHGCGSRCCCTCNPCGGSCGRSNDCGNDGCGCGNDNCGCDCGMGGNDGCGCEQPSRPIPPPPPPRPPRPPYEDCGCN